MTKSTFFVVVLFLVTFTKSVQSQSVCFPNPCQYNNTCVQTIDNSFNCTCRYGYNGTLCEVKYANLTLDVIYNRTEVWWDAMGDYIARTYYSLNNTFTRDDALEEFSKSRRWTLEPLRLACMNVTQASYVCTAMVNFFFNYTTFGNPWMQPYRGQLVYAAQHGMREMIRQYNYYNGYFNYELDPWIERYNETDKMPQLQSYSEFFYPMHASNLQASSVYYPNVIRPTTGTAFNYTYKNHEEYYPSQKIATLGINPYVTNITNVTLSDLVTFLSTLTNSYLVCASLCTWTSIGTLGTSPITSFGGAVGANPVTAASTMMSICLNRYRVNVKTSYANVMYSCEILRYLVMWYYQNTLVAGSTASAISSRTNVATAIYAKLQVMNSLNFDIMYMRSKKRNESALLFCVATNLRGHLQYQGSLLTHQIVAKDILTMAYRNLPIEERQISVVHASVANLRSLDVCQRYGGSFDFSTSYITGASYGTADSFLLIIYSKRENGTYYNQTMYDVASSLTTLGFRRSYPSTNCTSTSDYICNMFYDIDPLNSVTTYLPATPYDYCDTLPCQNGGTCVNGANGYTCVCTPEWVGVNCTIPNACISQPCMNGGVCTPSSVTPAYTCSCNNTCYIGSRCQDMLWDCGLYPCLNEGICSQTTACYVNCTCINDYTGQYCELAPTACRSNPCQNGASCIASNLTLYTCTCIEGYTGTQCQTNIDECVSLPCMNGGTCVDGVNEYACSCTNEYYDKQCNLEAFACSSHPCVNGSCIPNQNYNYTCFCDAGYSGVLCQTNINECASAPCHNGATCTDGVASYTCACACGYTGSRCDVEINECSSDPCVGESTCNDVVCGYTCTCTAGYSGARCQTVIDYCASQPCMNGGACSAGVEQFTCLCKDTGYTGVTCNIPESPVDCILTYCMNGGTCAVSPLNDQERVCLCAAGYEGSNCEQEVDECTSAPCMNGGGCVDYLNGFVCKCASGFKGRRCHVDIDECESDPCAHNGTCTDLVNGYSCECTEGYRGARCTRTVNSCQSSPCANGGTCLNNEVDPGFLCSCVEPHVGWLCDALRLPTSGAMSTNTKVNNYSVFVIIVIIVLVHTIITECGIK